jgi:glutathione S-transferase
MVGGTPDDAVVRESLPHIALVLSELNRIVGDAPWFGGDQVCLADIHLAPIFAYMMNTPEGVDLLKPHQHLSGWWQRMSARDSMQKTQPRFG